MLRQGPATGYFYSLKEGAQFEEENELPEELLALWKHLEKSDVRRATNE